MFPLIRQAALDVGHDPIMADDRRHGVTQAFAAGVGAAESWPVSL